ncbi:MAG: transcription termination/antitermination protein NusG [Vicinamibacterales bacterium]
MATRAGTSHLPADGAYSCARIDGEPRWFVVHTKPHNERRVDHNLRGMALETLCPMLCDTSYVPDRPARPRVKPLFPGYIFGRFNVLQDWHRVRFTRGVRDVLSLGGRPLPVEDEIIHIVMSRMDGDGLVRVADAIQAGDRVVIRSGPFRDLVGIFEAPANDQARITVLLTAVNWSARVDVAKDSVSRAEPERPRPGARGSCA